MKAVPVLLFLALAHGIGASIFKHQDRQVDDPNFPQLKHIEIFKEQHRNQPSEIDKQRYHHRYQQPGQQRSHQQDQQHDQERDLQSAHRQNLEWDQTGEHQHKEQNDYSQEEQYKHNEQPSYQMKYHPSSTEQLQKRVREQYLTFKQLQNSQHKQKTHPYADASSSDSSQRSQESQERRQYNDNTKSNFNRWTPQDSVASLENQKTAIGDVIERKDVHMSVNPSVLVQDKEVFEKIFGDAQKVMKHISDDEKTQFHHAFELAKQQHNEDDEANATQLAQKHQYPVEEHTVKTDDGYVLTLFRIPPKKQIRDVQKRPVVFLMHGIDGSADDWLLMGPQKSLAYLLSDAGYDVWLGNARGNKYSKNHVSKHPAVSDFWQYGIDEIALHDLPAMIDYALETTKQEKLFYIGHSQGTTAFFALTATRPEYNDKIIMMYALSPVVYMNNVRSPLFRMISPSSKFYNYLHRLFGNGPFTPNKELIQTVGGAMLEKATGCKEVSSNINFVMAGVNFDVSDAQLIAVMMRHLPAGTSSKVIKQYGQAVASQEFRRYDYGPKINMKMYGKEQPPKYEMEKVQAPVTLYYSEEDWLAHPKDVERLEKELPNVKETYKVSEENFGNMDFQFSTKAPEMVYRRLIESMQNNQ